MRTVESNTTSSSNRKLADGYINIHIVDKNNKKHSFKVGIPLYADRALDNKFLKDIELFNRLIKEGVVTGTVWIAGNQTEDDIAF